MNAMFADRRVLFAGEVDIQGGPPLSRRMLREKLLFALRLMELPSTSSSLPTTSTMASGCQTIIILSPPPSLPAGALLDGDALLDGRCTCPPL